MTAMSSRYVAWAKEVGEARGQGNLSYQQGELQGSQGSGAPQAGVPGKKKVMFLGLGSRKQWQLWGICPGSQSIHRREEIGEKMFKYLPVGDYLIQTQ